MENDESVLRARIVVGRETIALPDEDFLFIQNALFQRDLAEARKNGPLGVARFMADYTASNSRMWEGITQRYSYAAAENAGPETPAETRPDALAKEIVAGWSNDEILSLRRSKR